MVRKPARYAPHVYYRDRMDYGIAEATAVTIEREGVENFLCRLMEQLEANAAIPPAELCKVLGPGWSLRP